jgi:ADP-ribose pyrophosphatase YjhB (NUDIX family)
MRFRVGVFASIFDEQGRVLLGHRRDGDFWGQPGGGLERGEPPWAGVVREVKEETGLEVTVERLAGIYCWPALDEIIFSFVCRAAGGALTSSEETRDVRFFALDQLPPNTFAEHVARIRDAVAAMEQPWLRELRGASAVDELAGRDDEPS